jgi:hypothetical protein
MFDRPHSVYVEGLVEIFVLVTKKIRILINSTKGQFVLLNDLKFVIEFRAQLKKNNTKVQLSKKRHTDKCQGLYLNYFVIFLILIHIVPRLRDLSPDHLIEMISVGMYGMCERSMDINSNRTDVKNSIFSLNYIIEQHIPLVLVIILQYLATLKYE